MTDIHIGSIERRMPGNVCPTCGKAADGGTSLDDKAAARMPKPGDIAICLYCGALNRYGEGLRLHPCTPAERKSLLRDPRIAKLVEIASTTSRAWRKKIQ
jgi:hypothetical protein